MVKCNMEWIRAGAWAGVGVACLLGRAPAADAAVVFADDFEDATTVPGKPNAPQVGAYPTTAPLIPESNVVAAGGTHPASPGGGSNLFNITGRQRNYFPLSTTATGDGSVRFEFDAMLVASSQLSFALNGDAAFNSLDGQPMSIWLHIASNGSIHVYNAGWSAIPGLNHTVGAWQSYAVEYDLGASEFAVTAGGDTVVVSTLNGVPSVSQITSAYLSGGTDSFNGYADNLVVDFTPVPEPASAALLGLAGALALVRRR